MKYKIIVDKQPKTNPSNDKREYEIDIEELRITNDGTVYDSLIITKAEDYVIRRLSLSSFGILSILDEPIKQPIENINIKLFKGDNYIYLIDPVGNRVVAEYLIENEFTDMYVTDAEMNSAITQTESKIELSVNQKLTSYSTIEELTQAKQDAIDKANSDTDDKLQDYATIVEMNASLGVAVEGINAEVSKKYTTKEETNTAKKEAIDSANDSTDNKLKDYSTTEDTNKAKQDAIDSSNSSTDEKLKSYSTTVEMNAALEIAIEGINLSVSQKYSTKEETDTAKQDAIDSANATTDEKLEGYSTTSDTNKAKEDAVNSANASTDKKLEEYSTTEDTDKAKQEAIDSANESTDNKLKNYSTTSDTDKAKQDAIKSADSNTDKKLEDYSTTIQMNAALELNTESIMLEVDKKVNDEDFGTKITQNIESVKVAWNQISQYIQMMIINQKASLAILDSSNNLVTNFDQDGQHFYKDNSEVFGEMGVKTVDNQNYITFSVPTDYNKEINDGMAWGITTTSDDKFFPILFIKNFHMGAKQSDDFSGELILNACDLVLSGMGSGIISGTIKMMGDVPSSLRFIDTETNKNLLTIAPPAIFNPGMENGFLLILDKIQFYSNQLGSNSFKIGDENNYILMSDTGDFHVQGNGGAMFGVTGKGINFDVYPMTMANIWGTLDVDGNVYANNISSDRRLKKNIKDSNICALDIIKQIKHRQFDMKKDNKHYKIGYIAQELETIEPNFILKREKTAEIEERYYINELPIISTITKAIQELLEQMEDMKNRIVLLERSK